MKAIDRLILLQGLILTYQNNRKLLKQLVFRKHRPRKKLSKNTKKRLMNMVRLLEAAIKQDLTLTSLEIFSIIVDIIMTVDHLDLCIEVV